MQPLQDFFQAHFFALPLASVPFSIPVVKPCSLRRGFKRSVIASNLASRFFSSPASSAQRGLALSKSSYSNSRKSLFGFL
tara:strand:+ start:686 stop:925 length:240 start_codon:yes stop_codon:yes gene_type:complete